ncbi:CaiB/BaiF CoA transferase family protein [Egibacter rhizosphaerae]|uniref:CaiB/BaiF CoA transferase family protein n=1 Tax=Egibacter rhizosphaerae TaxID=1670831 RepID=UPI0013F14DAC|nr:CaiB/BaiF CoA-transferase family protein [Egibacter rhizosphaerae]
MSTPDPQADPQTRPPTATGPLAGLRILELAGIGPGPFAAMVLADAGAEVIRIDRPGEPRPGANSDPLLRSRRSIAIDLKAPGAAELVARLATRADALIEGFRPGVAERLGVGPRDLHPANPALVYGRITGWGQTGPRASRAGHDLDYIALAGALHPIGPPDHPPPPPLNYVGDFGGGGFLLAFGVLAAILRARASGEGEVVDAAMIDGAAAQTAMLHGMRAAGLWSDQREANLLDGAAPFYRTYETADGEYIAVGALEPPFYAELLEALDLDPERWPQHDLAHWPGQRRELAEIFGSRTRAHWEAVFADRDACVAPVLAPGEAPEHPHHRERRTFVDVGGVTQPAPAPRFAGAGEAIPVPPKVPGADTFEVLADAGLGTVELTRLHHAGVVWTPDEG